MIGKAPFYMAAFGVGLLLAAQPSLNAEVARQSGHPLIAAILSLFVSFAIMLPFSGGAWSTGFGWASEIPWWAWLGGLAGAAFVLGSLTIVPAIGVVAFFGFVVFGQIIGSALIDQFGLFDMAVRPISAARALAIGLVLSGVVLFLRAAP